MSWFQIGLANSEAVAKAVVQPEGVHAGVRPLVFITSASLECGYTLIGIDTTNDRQRSLRKSSFTLSRIPRISEEKSMIHEVIGMGDTVVRG